MIALYTGKYTEKDLEFLELILSFSIGTVKTSSICKHDNCNGCEVVEACKDLIRLQIYVHNTIKKYEKIEKSIDKIAHTLYNKTIANKFHFVPLSNGAFEIFRRTTHGGKRKK